MKYSKSFLIILIFFIAHNNAMENNKNNKMIDIISENDVGPFVGKVVAYVTSSFVLGKEGGYVLHNSVIKYGYVEDKGHGNRQMRYPIYGDMLSPQFVYKMFPNLDEDYVLHQLLNKRGDVPHSRYLTNEILDYAYLTMRNVNQKEIEGILNAVQNKKARFDYLDAEYSLFGTILRWLQDKK